MKPLAKVPGVSLPSYVLAATLLPTAPAIAQGAVEAVSRKEQGHGLEETRLAMGKWIETQQIIAKERKEWQQSKEILGARIEVVQKELTTLGEKIQAANANIGKATEKGAALQTELRQLESLGDQLAKHLTTMESEVRKLWKTLPEPVRVRLQPVYQRMPEDAARAKVSIAERFQNVLGILNDLNKSNQEISVGFEVRELANGKPAEVKVVYVGLAQAFYVSASGEAGIGRPSPEGWKWESAKPIAGAVLAALEILQGKQSPAFVPLPVKIQ